MLLEFLKVSKSYKTRSNKKIILDDVSFKLNRGKNVGILGRNGAGKSTLVRLIGKVQKPDSGLIKHGVRFSWPMGFSGGFNSNLTGEENLKFVAQIYGADYKRVLNFVYDFSELGNDLKNPLRTYSSGMRAKLAFGLSMAIDFECYLIDEVMGVGDAKFQEKSKLFFKERKQSSDLIIISHNMKNIRENCDVIAILSKGKIHMYDNVEEGIKIYQKEE